MTYLAKDLRSQADYIRGCLKQGNLGYADAKMLEKIEHAAARITTQHSSLDDLQTLAKEQAELNDTLTEANDRLTQTNHELRQSMELVVQELSATLAKMHRDGTNETCSSYRLFETLELARKALK